jgi:hypothetical protein
VKKFFHQLIGSKKIGAYVREELEKVKVLSAQPMVKQIMSLKGPVQDLRAVEFSAFSQWGDDGIIQYLIHQLPITQQTFIEFGVGNYLEANTRFLLINNNWKGLIFDGSAQNMDFVKNDSISWKYDLTAIPLFVTKHNINQAIEAAGFSGELGILHIDIDGNDYWIWECLTIVQPQIVIMEYNSMFGNKAAISVPYDDQFYVTNAHYSNLYFGASLKAMCELADKKGYSFVGSNTNGNNAYFVRKDKLGAFPAMSAEQGYVAARFKQNRDASGNLTLTADSEAIWKAKDKLVVNVSTGEMAPLSNFL